MNSNNYQRLLALADEVFGYKDDPSQINVNQEVREKLIKMHPSTLSEFDDGKGPIAWVLLIPTTHDLMMDFLNCKITELELFELTPLDVVYNALYMCSALVLEEHRRKGIVKRLTLEAIKDICYTYPIQSLFVWSFSKEGDIAAEKIAQSAGLPLLKRQK